MKRFSLLTHSTLLIHLTFDLSESEDKSGSRIRDNRWTSCITTWKHYEV